MFIRRIVFFVFVLASGCASHKASIPQVIVLGIDGMDPSFVERHWASLPNLSRLRDSGYFGRLATTTPPQSPVAWSTFITGLKPDEHGIYDFVHRDPVSLLPYSSISRTKDAKTALPLGPYLLPLSASRIYSLRRGNPFWQTLSEHGVPVIVQRMPTNYPPVTAGKGLSGMGTPDLLGTQGTFTFFTNEPGELGRTVPGGQIEKCHLINGRALLEIAGPPNPLRKDHAPAKAVLTVDVDPENDAARFKLGSQTIILRQGEWSGWLSAEFTLIPHISSITGNVRLLAKQLHPSVEIYVSPINVDPTAPALPIATPKNYAAEMESAVGPFFTLGIPEDTAALRQSVFDLRQFQQQAALVFESESRLLDESLKQYKSGFLFFYFSTIDQNSHILWKRHEDELLKVYQQVDACVGRVRASKPGAELIIISDHGFTSFDRAVHLNAWLNQRGFLTLQGQAGPDASLDMADWKSSEAYALGLNGLYLNRKGRESSGSIAQGEAANSLLASLQDQLLAWRDPSNGQAVIRTASVTHPSSANRNVAPDLVVGYAPGYRASWQTGLGQIPNGMIEDNQDAWIGDHCINPADVPGVLFSSRRIKPNGARLQDVTATVMQRYGLSLSSPSDARAFQ